LSAFFLALTFAGTTSAGLRRRDVHDHLVRAGREVVVDHAQLNGVGPGRRVGVRRVRAAALCAVAEVPRVVLDRAVAVLRARVELHRDAGGLAEPDVDLCRRRAVDAHRELVPSLNVHWYDTMLPS
jgi:hypothetical protein